MSAMCPVRSQFASAVLAVGALQQPVEVNFGSWEHPNWQRANYLRPAEDRRFHFVERDGLPARVHDHQFRAEFRAMLDEVMA